MLLQMYVLFSAIIPRKFLDGKVKTWLKHAGSRDDERIWAGTRLFFATLMGLIFFLIPFSLFPLINVLLNTEIYFDTIIRILLMIVFGIFGFLATLILFYLHLNYVIDGRKRMVESILPDFLFLVGNNLKSGMTPFYAFRSAVRPEFGPLSEEIQIATQKSLGVDSFSDALKQIAVRIDSKVLSDTTKFFAQALKSGGRLAQLIETSANDIKQTNQLKNELITATRMYSLFIIFVVAIASPMLLAVSVQFLVILGGIQGETAGISGGSAASAGSQIGFAAGATTITPEFMQNMGYMIIFCNSILASVFIGVLGGGKIRDGLKFAPIMAMIGIGIFIILLQVVGSLVGGFG